MIESHCCFIKEKYFIDHADFKNMLDPGDTSKQSKRTWICVEVSIGSNKFYIPLRNNLGQPLRKYGRIGFSVPSAKRQSAGLDYRYALLINDSQYIEPHTSEKLPNSQYKNIKDNYIRITNEFNQYVKRFVNVAKRNRISNEPLFRNSSLVNFLEELGVIERMVTIKNIIYKDGIVMADCYKEGVELLKLKMNANTYELIDAEVNQYVLHARKRIIELIKEGMMLKESEKVMWY